jgi:hypothetical protein
VPRDQLVETFGQEWNAASAALRSGQRARAMLHLIHAHQLGQGTTRLHALSHLGFMRVALQSRKFRAAGQQLMLMLGALLFTWTWTEPVESGLG